MASALPSGNGPGWDGNPGRCDVHMLSSYMDWIARLPDLKPKTWWSFLTPSSLLHSPDTINNNVLLILLLKYTFTSSSFFPILAAYSLDQVPIISHPLGAVRTAFNSWGLVRKTDTPLDFSGRRDLTGLKAHKLWIHKRGYWRLGKTAADFQEILIIRRFGEIRVSWSSAACLAAEADLPELLWKPP